MTDQTAELPKNFIRQIIDQDIAAGKNDGNVITRFPPEPNGYLHIGHAKSICLNFGVARDYEGHCNLRFDDTNPEKESPYRNRSVKENLELFTAMRAGNFKEGEHVLRAKIDMASPNINMRDPILYRIKYATHPKTQDKWCIYPMYDYTHCISDALEGVTHSICTLEFEDHRPLYDWILDALNTPCHPQQIEFARLSLEYTVTSKRKLNLLIENNHVEDWDDPRMPTITGMRRRGITPESIRSFCDRIGVTKKDAFIEMSVLENCVREDLDPRAKRIMCVLDPLKVVIENYPSDQQEEFSVNNHPKDLSFGTRSIPFSNTIYIEHDDFMENPPKKFYRLAPGKEVRLRNGYNITCTEIIKNDAGEITELRCSYDPESKGTSGTRKKVKGIIHWVSAKHAINVETRLYDRLFNVPDPAVNNELASTLNLNSLKVFTNSKIEPSAKTLTLNDRIQFERQGYFCLDSKHSNKENLVFNRIVTLRDSWAKIEAQNK